jgi:nicotinamidase-related amidase
MRIALIIIDMQRAMQGTDPALRNNPQAEQNID